MAEKCKNTIDAGAKSDIMITGARITDPDSPEAKAFAKSYYEEIRKRKTDYKTIAQNIGESEEDILKIKNYLFVDKSLYIEGLGIWRRFYPDCAIAHSWQRLIDGKNIKQHDITLIKHELYEMQLKADNPNIDHDTAHEIAQKKYNYAKEAKEYYGEIKKY